ncbi:MAG: hypothetical protein SFW08_06175 [Gemmatimonadaceae bacterium]|nr:hypothetical protein [Gemmatimonadaceae bacterium]
MKSSLSIAATAALVLAAACADGSAPMNPDQVLPGPADLAWLHYEGPGRNPEPGKVKICKFRDISAANLNPTVGVRGTFTTTATSGTVLFPTLELDEEYCEYLWEGTENTRITISEDQSGASKFVSGSYYGFRTDIQQWDFIPITSPTFTIDVDVTRGTAIKISNRNEVLPPPPPPTEGGQGCTPGYWKQSQHFDSWTAPYTPSTTFASVFGSTVFGNRTLLQVVSAGGGGTNALGRHAVAALLNAASGPVSYDLTTAAVISAFNTAVATRTVEQQKNVFAGFNEQGCPLN